MRQYLKVIFFLVLLATSAAVAIAFTHKKPDQKTGSLQNPVLNNLSLVKEPSDLEVCFSPEEPCDLKLTKLVDGAQKTLDLAIYDINLEVIIEKLLEKAKRLRIRIVVDQRQAKGDHSQVKRLIEAGMAVRYGKQRGIFHHKFVIADNRIMETGSFNFTNHAAKANQENQIYLSNPVVLKRYIKRFEEIWATAKTPKADW